MVNFRIFVGFLIIKKMINMLIESLAEKKRQKMRKTGRANVSFKKITSLTTKYNVMIIHSFSHTLIN